MRVRSHLPVALLLVLAACDGGPDESLDVCPRASVGPTADTLIGARVDGRAVLVGQGSPRSVAAFSSRDPNYLYIFGWQIGGSRAQIIDLRIYGFHGVGSYPILDRSDSSYAWAAYGCEFPPASLLLPPLDQVTYWPVTPGLAGDSVWVTSWDSVTGHARGSFAFHLWDPAGGMVPISDGTFDVVVSR